MGLLNISHGFFVWTRMREAFEQESESGRRLAENFFTFIKLELLVSATDLSSGYCVNGVERHSSFPFVQDVIGYKLEPSCASSK